MPEEFYIDISVHGASNEDDPFVGRLEVDDDDPTALGEKILSVIGDRRRRTAGADDHDMKVVMLQWPLTINDLPNRIRSDASIIISSAGIVVKNREGAAGGVASPQMVEDATQLTKAQLDQIVVQRQLL